MDDQHAPLIPGVDDLARDYGVDPETAFAVSRSKLNWEMKVRHPCQ